MNNFISRLQRQIRKLDFQFVALLLLISLLYIFWTWNHELAEFGGDNAEYLLIAQSYSPWATPSKVADYFANQTQYPPLYPFLLAVFGGGQNVLAAHLITTGFLILSFIIMRIWLGINGLKSFTSNLTILLFSLLPGTVAMAMYILSENLYVFFSLMVLVLVGIFEKKENSRYLLIAAIFISAATLTRTVGISLAAAFCLYLWIKRPSNFLVSGIIALAPMIFYAIAKKSLSADHSYITALISHYNNNSLIKIADQIKDQLILLWYGWLDHFEAGPLSFLVGILLVFSFLGFVTRMYQRKTDGFYVLFYMIIIFLWPYPAEAKRFVYPILPIMVGQSLFLLDRIPAITLLKIPIRPVSLFVIIMLISSLPGTALTAQRFLLPLPSEFEPYKRNEYLFEPDPISSYYSLKNAKIFIEDLKTLDAQLPFDAIIYGTKPSIISFYSKRLCLRFPGRNEVDDFLQVSRSNTKPVYFYMTAYVSPSIPEPYYPMNEIEDQVIVMRVTKTSEMGKSLILTILARPM